MKTQNPGWFARLKAGLTKTSSRLGEGIAHLLLHQKIDPETLQQLEELLISADIGAKTATKIVERFGRQRLGKEVSADEIKTLLADEIAQILTPVAKDFHFDSAHKPHVVLVVGVNGNGKTTTIGKLAKRLSANHTVMLAAADTFRAAAVEQLHVWGERTGCKVISGPQGTDPASIAYQAYEQARAEQCDILLIDSAGRLHNKTNLMEELQKIIRVLKKIDPHAPHSVLQVLDATTGQNALNQVDVFKSMVHVTGLVVTKLDGTAKGGIVVALADTFGLPVHAIGVGEQIDDLQPFEAHDYARNLLGI